MKFILPSILFLGCVVAIVSELSAMSRRRNWLVPVRRIIGALVLAFIGYLLLSAPSFRGTADASVTGGDARNLLTLAGVIFFAFLLILWDALEGLDRASILRHKETEERAQVTETRVQGIETHVQSIDTRVQGIETHVQSMLVDVQRLSSTQLTVAQETAENLWELNATPLKQRLTAVESASTEIRTALQPLTSLKYALQELQSLRRALQQIQTLKPLLEETAQLRSAVNFIRAGTLEVRHESAVSQVRGVDETPWEHPYLTRGNIQRFREYSEAVWEFGLRHYESRKRPLNCAFVVNMAQNMNKWASLALKHGISAALFPHPMDLTAINAPEWEVFDGEWADIFDGRGFLAANPDLKPPVPTFRIPMEGQEFISAVQDFKAGHREPLLKLLSLHPDLRYEVLMNYDGFYPYYSWAAELSRFDVVYGCSSAFAAYASGRPYCMTPVGADLQFDCARTDALGQTSTMLFNMARFLTISNPHALAHSRRLGLTNGVYLPYPMDDARYSPGEPVARKKWEELYAPGVYVLATSRLDSKVKGYDDRLFDMLVNVARNRPQVRFLFLGWGENLTDFQHKIADQNLRNNFIVLKPVGKERLIDYYRSADIIIDQFVFGYYGATGLEAASVGKPVIIKLRLDHYDPLYKGDVMPAVNVTSVHDLNDALIRLIDSQTLRMHTGTKMREWLVRNHGEKRTMPLLLGLLSLAADNVTLPQSLRNPLLDEEAVQERSYYASCQPMVTV